MTKIKKNVIKKETRRKRRIKRNKPKKQTKIRNKIKERKETTRKERLR